jgi:hypothetical protein
MPKSTCCNSEAVPSYAGEGAADYTCSWCRGACDVRPVEGEPSPDREQIIDNFIRDVTSVEHMSKSEVRRRLGIVGQAIIDQYRDEIRERLKNDADLRALYEEFKPINGELPPDGKACDVKTEIKWWEEMWVLLERNDLHGGKSLTTKEVLERIVAESRKRTLKEVREMLDGMRKTKEEFEVTVDVAIRNKGFNAAIDEAIKKLK